MLEEEMSRPFEIASENYGFTTVTAEVPIMHRCADYVMYMKEYGIVSVELKVHKWRHAIEQAMVHALASDGAYICLPKGYHTKEFYEALEEADIGFMSLDVDNCVLEIIRKPGRRNVPKFRADLIERVESISSYNVLKNIHV